MWRSTNRNERDEERKQITVLFRKISAKYWIPLSPISLLGSSSVVSVYEKGENENKRDKWREKEIYHVVS